LEPAWPRPLSLLACAALSFFPAGDSSARAPIDSVLPIRRRASRWDIRRR
jgi:hypothetical protein